MEPILKVASQISTPLILAGVVIAVLYGIFKLGIARIPTLSKTAGTRILFRIVNWIGILAFVALILGFIGFALPTLLEAIGFTNTAPRQILLDADFSLFSPSSAGCRAHYYDADEDEWHIQVNCLGKQAITFANQEFLDFDLEVVTRKVAGSDRAWYGITLATGLKTPYERNYRFLISGLGTYTYEIATFNGGDRQAELEIIESLQNKSNGQTIPYPCLS